MLGRANIRPAPKICAQAHIPMGRIEESRRARNGEAAGKDVWNREPPIMGRLCCGSTHPCHVAAYLSTITHVMIGCLGRVKVSQKES